MCVRSKDGEKVKNETHREIMWGRKRGRERKGWGFLSSHFCSLIKVMTQAQGDDTHTWVHTHTMQLLRTITEHFANRPQLLACITLRSAFSLPVGKFPCISLYLPPSLSLFPYLSLHLYIHLSFISFHQSKTGK